MAKVIRLTEGDLHRMIRESVNRILKEEWRASYDKWANGEYDDAEEGERLNREWTKKLKKQYPNPADRKRATERHMSSRTSQSAKDYDRKWRKEHGDESDDED